MHVAILGNGISGVSTALRLRARRPDWRITIVSGESRYHWSRPALMYVFMGHMRYRETKPFEDSFWEERGLSLHQGWVRRVDRAERFLEFADQPPIHWDKLVLATGSRPNRFGWPGQDLAGVQGLWGLADLKRLYDNAERTRHAVIVGGGLIGIELAEMLHSRGIGVTLLVRESAYWNNVLPDEEARMVGRHIERHGLDLRLGTELREIVGGPGGRCAAVVTGAGERIECQLVGLTAGVSPNVDVARASGIPCGRGVLVDGRLRSQVEDVYAVGDCAEIVAEGDGPNLLQQVWYTGKRQGEVLGDVLAGEERRYDPGIWFNSAKFLDLEYQTYGRVAPGSAGALGSAGAPSSESLYWEHADGEHSIRIVHEGGRVVGFNVMGLRWRHEVCERWIARGATVAEVLGRLEEASFDPEFFRRHEAVARGAFEEALR